MNDHTVMFINLSPSTYLQLLSITKGCGLSVCDVAPSRYQCFRGICCLHSSTLKMEAVSSSKCWYSNTKVHSVIIQTTTDLISTSNLSSNSTIHNQQKYTPITQSKVQQCWHHCK
jgi:hypothetical protein